MLSSNQIKLKVKSIQNNLLTTIQSCGKAFKLVDAKIVKDKYIVTYFNKSDNIVAEFDVNLATDRTNVDIYSKWCTPSNDNVAIFNNNFTYKNIGIALKKFYSDVLTYNLPFPSELTINGIQFLIDKIDYYEENTEIRYISNLEDMMYIRTRYYTATTTVDTVIHNSTKYVQQVRKIYPTLDIAIEAIDKDFTAKPVEPAAQFSVPESEKLINACSEKINNVTYCNNAIGKENLLSLIKDIANSSFDVQVQNIQKNKKVLKTEESDSVNKILTKFMDGVEKEVNRISKEQKDTRDKLSLANKVAKFINHYYPDPNDYDKERSKVKQQQIDKVSINSIFPLTIQFKNLCFKRTSYNATSAKYKFLHDSGFEYTITLHYSDSYYEASLNIPTTNHNVVSISSSNLNKVIANIEDVVETVVNKIQ